MTTFAVLTNPTTPLFAECYNPYLKIVELIGCPRSGESMAVEHWFFEYFTGMSIADREEILAAFDRDGYYETFEDSQSDFDSPVYRYIVTLYPASNNAMVEDSDEAAQESLQDFCALVAENFRNDSLI